MDAKALHDDLQSLGFTPNLANPEIGKEVGRRRAHSLRRGKKLGLQRRYMLRKGKSAVEDDPKKSWSGIEIRAEID